MSNRWRFLLAVAAFWRIFTPDTATPSAADPRVVVTEDSAIAIEFVTPPIAEGDGLDSSGQHEVTGTSSLVPDEAPPADLAVTVLPAEAFAPDPWAEAFAESARLMSMPADDSQSYPVDHDHDQVRFFLDRFTGSGRAIIGNWLNRSSTYLTMIRGTFKTHGLPEDLAFTAMIESGFNPLAVSHAGAKGLWQFMAGTARRYGLRVDQWVDERLDPEKSTVAAASYLRDLYGMFGSWHLAQAAYNAGEMTVTRAIMATGSTDFWTLARSRFLKRETKEFVPQIQAATVIGRDPARFGFETAEAAELTADRILVPPSTDLRRLSVASGIPSETLRSLNPVLVRGITPPGAAYELKVPAGSRASVVSAIARKERVQVTTVAKASGSARKPASVVSAKAAAPAGVHVVQPRDTVSTIAKQYGVSVSDVLRWNRLGKQDAIRPGDRLLVANRSVEREGQGGFR
jgi:membrane-bound lytic murein transglycosylase D